MTTRCNFFYLSSQLSVELSETQSRYAFQASHHLLAQLHSTASNAALLTTDTQNTVQHWHLTGSTLQFVHSVYGHCSDASAALLFLSFSGQHLDIPTNAYLLGSGYRAYSPTKMRFHSPDTLSPFGAGGLNAYAYCAGDPINASDPSGHSRLRRSNSVPTLHAQPKLRRLSMPELQGVPAGLEKISHLPPMDKILSHLGNKDLINLSQTSKALANTIGARSLHRAKQLSDSMEILAAAEGNREGILPKHALEMAAERYPDYKPGAKDLMKVWQTSREADSYQGTSTTTSVFVGPRGILGIRQGHQKHYLSPI
ncbi:RHS repeat-associated core domain-containing protein [Pseudomonas sp. 5FOS]|uniref:RHS repeat-associated core domain-containing protein n=1 Tax=unclassified Pseudomonas TaxID=196821 RepID=UPI001F34FED9|nr:RHS repeat-associated core domain-containing protein [Pseudomonas sp. LM20]MCE5986087.1 RHS repeat-associated core domain-containing protein [Pseudomonas sp. LM20]